MRVSTVKSLRAALEPRLWLALIALVALLPGAGAWAGAAPAVAAEGPGSFVFEGAGWGHGVGLSQYGAKGQAISDPNLSGVEIVEYYYPGADIVGLDTLTLSNDYLFTEDNPLWINLATDRTLLTFSAVGGPLDLCLSNDGEGECPKPEHPQSGETWTFETLSGGGCAFFRGGVQQGTAGACQASISWPDATGVDVEDVCDTGNVHDCRYEHGEIKIRPAGSRFHVSIALPLEDYLLGMGELPIDWTEPGANEAQVIASRSYAVYEFLRFESSYARTAINAGVPTSCYCHMFDDARDQAYVGTQINGLDRMNLASVWTDAVASTDGQVISYAGPDASSFTRSGVVKAFYFSSSGGWTESNVSGFDAPTQFPFFEPVPDPWSLDQSTGNPFASWTETVSAAQIADALGVDDVVSARMISPIPEALVEFGVIDDGVATTVVEGGGWLRTDLGLRSPSLLAIDGQGAGPPLPFDDIHASPHVASILALLDAEVTAGCDENSFCPQRQVTRGQMASFISRAMGLPAAGGDHFADDEASVHEDNINRLFEAGITAGCGTEAFCPDASVTRGQMAVFLNRALNLTESGDDESGVDAFTDDDTTPYEDAINAIAAAGITNGCTTQRFCPFDPVQRGQMAAFLDRAFLEGA